MPCEILADGSSWPRDLHHHAQPQQPQVYIHPTIDISIYSQLISSNSTPLPSSLLSPSLRDPPNYLNTHRPTTTQQFYQQTRKSQQRQKNPHTKLTRDTITKQHNTTRQRSRGGVRDGRTVRCGTRRDEWDEWNLMMGVLLVEGGDNPDARVVSVVDKSGVYRMKGTGCEVGCVVI